MRLFITRHEYKYSSFSDYSLNDYEKLLETKLHHLTKGIIGIYHYGLNIKHAEQVLEKGLIVNSLL